MSYRFEIAAGTSKKLLVGGKYCDRDIIVTAVGGSVVPDEPVTPEYSEGLDCYYDEWQGGYLVLGYGTWDGEDLVIPPTYNDGEHGELPVVGHGYSVLGNNSKIKSATFPETIDLIGSPIFENCPNLTHLYIPYIKYVASFCVWGLTGLEYVKFKDISSIEGGNFIGGNKSTVYDFTECASIPTLECYEVSEQFGDNPIIKVPANLLDEWKNATNWTLYSDYIVVEGQEEEDDSAKILDALIEGSITEISSDATTIRERAFVACTKLTSATFPNATSVGNNAFDGCKQLISASLPNATSIGTSAFSNCSVLTSINLPNATSIGTNAFTSCTQLTSISLPNATSIGGSAFMNCTRLESASFENVTSIGTSAFVYCRNCLEYDFSRCETVPTLSSTNAFSSINSNAKIKVPAALYDEWIAATNWSTYASYIIAV